MRDESMAALMIMNHDDFRFLFGTDRSQPRAIIPAEGPPVLVAFAGEEPELRASLGDGEVRVFTTVGGQIDDIVGELNEMASRSATQGIKPRIACAPSGPTPSA